MGFHKLLLVGLSLLCLGEARAADAPSVPALPAAEVLADLDPSNDDEVAPPAWIADCEGKLRAAGVRFVPASLPVKPGNAKRPTCGAEQAVVYQRGPGKIHYSSPPIVSCGMALGLARLERVLNEQAQLHLGQDVARVEHGGTYNCRRMSRFDLVSEHSYANAIDIRSVTLKNGRKLSVLRTFGKIGPEPKRREELFWRSTAQRLYDEGTFSVVLTPFFDQLHRDHLHLDQARYRIDGTRR
jgi:hypothetical protein